MVRSLVAAVGERKEEDSDGEGRRRMAQRVVSIGYEGGGRI